MMTRTTSTGLWARATKALGKFWHGMLTLPEQRPNQRQLEQEYPRFPAF
jgi:hypothetical protein